jgi:pyruvate-formate lyase-activating enzyme
MLTGIAAAQTQTRGVASGARWSATGASARRSRRRTYDGIAEFVADLDSVERVEVLPFHRLGAQKYTALGLPFPLTDTEPPDAALQSRVRRQFADRGLTVC